MNKNIRRSRIISIIICYIGFLIQSFMLYRYREVLLTYNPTKFKIFVFFAVLWLLLSIFGTVWILYLDKKKYKGKTQD